METNNKELLASDYAIAHYEQNKTYTALEVHKMLCDAFIAGLESKKDGRE